MQAALKQIATHKGIHRFGMQIGTLPGSRWMFAKGVCNVKSVQVKPPNIAQLLKAAVIDLAAEGCGSCRIRKVRL